MERARLMRWVLCAVVVLVFAPRALAQDYVLRGSEPSYRWAGVYGGADAGYTSSVVNFAQAASPEVAFILRETVLETDEQISTWSVLGKRNPEGTALGAFVGYNFDWNNVILGVEFDYNHVSLAASAANALTRSFTDSNSLPAGHHYYYTVSVGAQSALHMSDIVSFRSRFGWAAGNFLPYGFVGLAMSRVSTTTGAVVAYSAVDFPDSETPPLVPLPNLNVPPETEANSQNQFAYGLATGLGLDVGLTPNIFVRGELEYIYFAPVTGIQFSLTSARVGAGFKF
jgi:outer membrane immunogenic protein